MAFELHVNRKVQTVDVAGDTPLLWVLRDSLDMKGTKYGCGIGECGACTVLMNGAAVKSCQISVEDAKGPITTIEGLAENGKLTVVQQAWVDVDVAQCGYCQGGQILRATALLSKTPKPTNAEIDQAMSSNLCRCATYNRIRAAVKQAAGLKTAVAEVSHEMEVDAYAGL